MAGYVFPVYILLDSFEAVLHLTRSSTAHAGSGRLVFEFPPASLPESNTNTGPQGNVVPSIRMLRLQPAVRSIGGGRKYAPSQYIKYLHVQGGGPGKVNDQMCGFQERVGVVPMDHERFRQLQSRSEATGLMTSILNTRLSVSPDRIGRLESIRNRS